MGDSNSFEALANQLATVVQVQEVATRVLNNKPSPVLLSKCKEILGAETKKLLLLEREIYLSQSGDENWESNYWESFELIGSVLKKLTLIEKEIDEKLEGAPIVNPEDDCELISSYSMEAEQEAEEDESIIPSYLFEEDDDSHELELIPQFFFAEEEVDYSFESELIPPYFFVESTDVDLLTGRSLPCEEVETTERIEFSKDFITHIVLNSKNSLSLHLDFTHSIFDRGKAKLKFDSELRSPCCMGFQYLDRLSREIIQMLVYHSGYLSNRFSNDSMACMLANSGFITTAWCMFGKMLECEVMRRLFDRGKQFAAIHRYSYIVGAYEVYLDPIYCMILHFGSVFLNKDRRIFVHKLFDRGRTIESDVRCFSYDGNISSLCITSCLFACKGLKFIAYDGKSAYELNYKLGYRFTVVIESMNVVLFVKYGDQSDGTKMFEGSVFRLVKEINNGDISKLFDKEWQHFSVDGNMLIIQVAKGSGYANMQQLFYQKLAKDISRHTQLKEAWKVIIRQYKLLTFLTGYELTLCTFSLCIVRCGILLQLKCHLPINIEVHCIQTLELIVEGQAGEVLQILSREFKFFMVLNISVLTVATTHFYLLLIGSFQHSRFLKFDVYEQSMFQGVITTVRHISWSCLHMSHCTWCFPSCVSQVKALISRPKRSFCSQKFLLMLVGTQVSLRVIQVRGLLMLVVSLILKMLLWVGFLRWKFRMVLTRKWGEKNKHFPTATEFFLVKLLRITSGCLDETHELQILLKGFKNLLVLLFSVFPSVQTQYFYHPSISPSTPVTSRNRTTWWKIIQVYLNSATDSTRALYFVQWLCMVCRTTTGYTKFDYYDRMEIIQPLLTVTHVPNMLRLVVLLKWKFKLFLTGFWSMENVSWIRKGLMSVESLVVKWNCTNHTFWKAEVHNLSGNLSSYILIRMSLLKHLSSSFRCSQALHFVSEESLEKVVGIKNVSVQVHDGAIFCAGISLRRFFLTIYLSTIALPPRAPDIFAKILESPSSFVFDRGKFLFSRRRGLWYQPVKGGSQTEFIKWKVTTANLKQLLNPAPSGESQQDTRHCVAGMSQKFSIFSSFGSAKH